MEEKRRYAVVGLGSRSRMFTSALLTDFADRASLVAFCDPNRTRMDYYNRTHADLLGGSEVPAYIPGEFGRMLAEQRVDGLIVTSVDRTHDRYIIEGLESGCRVITEKPMTTDESKCRRILETVDKTGLPVTVSFNYRYAPRNSKVKELIQQGAIGEVLSVHFEWLLDTRHGADYFRRWHRDKRNSGGLMVHKASHHFDLVNWWLGTKPETVFGFGGLRFYGWDNAEARGLSGRSYRNHGFKDAGTDPWTISLADNKELSGLYLEAEHEDGYLRDRDVFSDGISIEDDMAVLVRYAGGATMTYHLTAYSPWEGYRVMFNGTKGRLELDVEERSYVSGGNGDPNRVAKGGAGLPPIDSARLTLRPLWEVPREITVEQGSGGHGGGDRRLLEDLFGFSVGQGASQGGQEDPLGRAASHVDGAYAMLTGAAANRSFATGLPVRIADLLTEPS